MNDQIASADAAARRGDLAGAAALLEQAVGAGQGSAELWSRLAACRRALGQGDAALAAIDRALAFEPRDPLALLMKGSLIEKSGADAEEPYRAALAFLGGWERLPPPLQAQVSHAAGYCEAAGRRRRASLFAVVAQAAPSLDSTERDRCEVFADALAEGLPTTVLPGLDRPDYFDSKLFPQLSAVATRFETYLREYRALMAAGDVVQPYVDHPDGAPLDQWAALNRSRDWSAAHLWRGGVPTPAAGACPETMAAWTTLPVADLPARAPNLMFSILAPRTAIPPHTGATNARLVVHVPLLVPPDCRMIVGGDARAWLPGEALVFDDTIKHEAVNGSDRVRVVLIGDVWHPGLTPGERGVLRALLDRGGGTDWRQDGQAAR